MPRDADPHDWRIHEGGYPWPNVALPCRDDPDLLDGVDVDWRSISDHARLTRHCRRCPVRHACLAYALEHGIMDGTWGGVTGPQRQATLRDLRRRYDA